MIVKDENRLISFYVINYAIKNMRKFFTAKRAATKRFNYFRRRHEDEGYGAIFQVMASELLLRWDLWRFFVLNICVTPAGI